MKATQEQIERVATWCHEKNGVTFALHGEQWRAGRVNHVFEFDPWQIVGVIVAACEKAGLGFVIQSYGRGHVPGYSAMVFAEGVSFEAEAKMPVDAAIRAVDVYLRKGQRVTA